MKKPAMKKSMLPGNYLGQGLKSFLLLLLVLLILPAMVQAETTYKEYTYTVTTKTGWKGTNADIMILLIGTKGVIEDFQLMDNPNRDDFEPNRIDVFTIYSQIDVGFVTDIVIKPHGSGLSVDNWKMEYIKVENSEYPGKITTFISTPVFDGKERQLRAEKYEGKPTITADTLEVFTGKKVFGTQNFSGSIEATREYEVSRSTEGTYKESSETGRTIKNGLEVKASTTFGDGIVIPEIDIETTYSFELTEEFRNATEKVAGKGKVETTRIPFTAEKCSMTFWVADNKSVSTFAVFDDGFGSKIRYQKPEGEKADLNNMDIYVFRAVDDKANGDCTNCPSFQELWVASGKPLSSMPNGPTLASRASLSPTNACYIPPPNVQNPAPAPVPDPKPQPQPQPQPKPQPVPEPTPITGNQGGAAEVAVCDDSGTVIGYFIQNGKNWVETGLYGNERFRFQETGRDQGVIYLSDKDRAGVKINLDLSNKAVLYSDSNNPSPFRIYGISSVN